MSRDYFYVFNEKESSNWRYCPECGEEILWIIADEDGGRITCAGDHPEKVVSFDVYSEDELNGEVD